MNIVIPMAGAGSRFAKEGYKLPKPFIDIDGRMMIERVLDGLEYDGANYILVIQEKFQRENRDELNKITKNYDVGFVTVERLTQGASCTALASHEIINDDIPVVFCDSDNIFENEVFVDFLEDALNRGLDGSLLTFETDKDCFSFVELDEGGFGIRTAEKDPISTHAIAGAYFFGKGSDFVKNVINMMIYNDRAKGEFYMSNVYNYLIRDGGRVGIFDIKDSQWDCVGTPAQLEVYLGKF